MICNLVLFIAVSYAHAHTECNGQSELFNDRRLYMASFNARQHHLKDDHAFKLFGFGLGLHDTYEVLGAGIDWVYI